MPRDKMLRLGSFGIPAWRTHILEKYHILLYNFTAQIGHGSTNLDMEGYFPMTDTQPATARQTTTMTDVGFTEQVIIVTGAGGGLGRAHAIELAHHGARVVVNDLGVNKDGTGSSNTPAEDTVKMILELGGEAVIDTNSVATIEGGAAIVQTAIDAFGRIDGVVNNAGILRDGMFHNASMQDINDVLGVHLPGMFHVTHAAWPHMREQGFGRVVFTTSASGMFGNAGQVNYGAAKMGLVGAMRALSQEGARKGIFVNAIAPVGDTRMTQGLGFPDELMAMVGPETVSPIVTALMSPACTVTGRIFSIVGPHIREAKMVETTGWTSPEPITPISFLEHIEKIGEDSHLAAHGSMNEEVMAGAAAIMG